MYHPAIIIAYYLDPRYRGQELTEEYPFTTIVALVKKGKFGLKPIRPKFGQN
jgi:hypothetical protein